VRIAEQGADVLPDNLFKGVGQDYPTGARLETHMK
jgi:hypothetical protein